LGAPSETTAMQETSSRLGHPRERAVTLTSGAVCALKRVFGFGLVVGLVFGCVNVVAAWLHPLDDDTPVAVLRFYGPMFAVWAIAACVTVRHAGRVLLGVASGAVVAVATFCSYYLAVLPRINVFLYVLTDRLDWQNMLARFHTSGYESLRPFVNVDYIKGGPFKIAVASVIGATTGLIGGAIGRMLQTRSAPLRRDARSLNAKV
jgi:hypothetical protein